MLSTRVENPVYWGTIQACSPDPEYRIFYSLENNVSAYQNAQSTPVDVLLSVYNGEKYLLEQINSLLLQTHPHIRLIVRDDGSSDNSADILKSLRLKHPDKITLVSDAFHLGANQSYSHLLKMSTAPYTMFCDQDDVWLPDKVTRTLNTMRSAERELGSKTAILVHTDMMVVDENLRKLDKSFFHYQNINPKKNTLNRLMVQNVITGCTMMINAKLREIVSPFPDGIIQHDWWIGLTAAAFGFIRCLREPTMKYRLHGTNQIGPKRWNPAFILRMAGDEFAMLPSALNRTYNQAGSFHTRFASRLPVHISKMVYTYSQFNQLSLTAKLIAVLKYGLFKQGIIRNIGYLLVTSS